MVLNIARLARAFFCAALRRLMTFLRKLMTRLPRWRHKPMFFIDKFCEGFAGQDESVILAHSYAYLAAR